MALDVHDVVTQIAVALVVKLTVALAVTKLARGGAHSRWLLTQCRSVAVLLGRGGVGSRRRSWCGNVLDGGEICGGGE